MRRRPQAPAEQRLFAPATTDRVNHTVPAAPLDLARERLRAIREMLETPGQIDGKVED